jgi:hypothetical protein
MLEEFFALKTLKDNEQVFTFFANPIALLFQRMWLSATELFLKP